MKADNLVGIVCSKDLSQAYCVIGSENYKKEIKEKMNQGKAMVIYIPDSMLSPLIHQSFESNRFKWNIEKVLEYSKYC